MVARVVARVLAAGAALLAVVIVVLLALGWRAFGHRATGERRARMERSAQFHDGALGGGFVNPQPMTNHLGVGLEGAMHVDENVSPKSAADVATVKVDVAALRTPPASGLRVTWLGHSTSLVELDGARVLLDPIWADRVSPFSFGGPARWYPPLVALDAFHDDTAVDVVIVSHDHYDHLDEGTITKMASLPGFRDTLFVVPLGIGAHLEYWGVRADHIVELDWWEERALPLRGRPLTITCTPSRHASGRMLVDDAGTLWASFALRGDAHRVWYSGDTGLFPALDDIGAKLGPFDLALVEVGQYHQAWPDWHLGPEQAVDAAQRVRAARLLPVHWGLFALAYHAWTEPIERALAAADAAALPVAAPRPGQSFEPLVDMPRAPWWPALPIHTGADDPIHATLVPARARVPQPR